MTQSKNIIFLTSNWSSSFIPRGVSVLHYETCSQTRRHYYTPHLLTLGHPACRKDSNENEYLHNIIKTFILTHTFFYIRQHESGLPLESATSHLTMIHGHQTQTRTTVDVSPHFIRHQDLSHGTFLTLRFLSPGRTLLEGDGGVRYLSTPEGVRPRQPRVISRDQHPCRSPG